MKKLAPSARAGIQPKALRETNTEIAETMPTAAGAQRTRQRILQEVLQDSMGITREGRKRSPQDQSHTRCKKAHLMDAYPCPYRTAFHVGHNFKLLYEFRNELEQQKATRSCLLK